MKSFMKNMPVFIMTVILCIFFSELFVRKTIPQQLIYINSEIWRPDPILGWRHNENINTVVNFGEGIIHYVTDERGFRINYQNDRRNEPDPEFSIIAIGDSYLEALGVENKFTILEILKNQLKEKYNKVVEVDNTGVGAWSPNQYLLIAKRELINKEYDLGIVFIYVANDIISHKKTSISPKKIESKHSFHFPRSFSQKEIISSVLYPINDYLETRSHLFILLKTRMQLTLSKLGLTATYFPPVFNLTEQDTQMWTTTTEVSNAIKDEFSKYNTPVLFVLLPTNYQVHEEAFYQYMEAFNIQKETVDLEQPNSILGKTFQENSLRLLDPLKVMREKAKEGMMMYGTVDRHFNKNGHKIVGEYIAPTVESYLH